jgi:hypothetical protein
MLKDVELLFALMSRREIGYPSALNFFDAVATNDVEEILNHAD